MMGPRQAAQSALFYRFSIEDHVPSDHLVRLIDRFVDLSDIRGFLSPIARTDAYETSRRNRKKVEMLFAHLKPILKLDRLRLRGPTGVRDEFHLAATVQNLRKLAKLVPVFEPKPA